MLPGSVSAAVCDPVDAPTDGLRRELIATSGSRSPRLLPPTVLASEDRRAVVRDYLAWWATHPNPAGSFASRTRWRRWLPSRLLPRAMFGLGYDGLIYVDAGSVAAHVFFQRRGADLHAFSTAVHPPFDGCGYSMVILLDFVAYAAAQPDVRAARVGRGQNKIAQRFLEHLGTHAAVLGWSVGSDGWIRFDRDAA
jgi:GNAT superfamily N-acetyltransferase